MNRLLIKGVIGDGTGRRNKNRTKGAGRKKRDGVLKEITLQGQLGDQMMVLDQEDLLPQRDKGLISSQRMSKRLLGRELLMFNTLREDMSPYQHLVYTRSISTRSFNISCIPVSSRLVRLTSRVYSYHLDSFV